MEERQDYRITGVPVLHEALTSYRLPATSYRSIPPVRPVNLPEIAQRADEIERADLRSLHVVPPPDRQLVNRARGFVAAAALHESGDDLHIEDPARQEGSVEQAARVVVEAEQLRTALRVVDSEAERRRDQRGADAPDVVAPGTAADLAAEEPHARREHHLLLGVVPEYLEKRGELVQRCGQVCVPETDEVRTLLRGMQKSPAHCLALSGVPSQSESAEPLRILGVERFEKVPRAVAAPIIDEAEFDARVARPEVAECLNGEALLLVVTGDHDHDMHHARAFSINLPAMEARTVEAVVHGRYLYEQRAPERLLVGFHGYGENAEKHILELQKIPGTARWSLAAIQALHPFYTGRSGGRDIVASWMTGLDRDMAIADNIEYVRSVLASIWRGSSGDATLVFAGFSQGVAMPGAPPHSLRR